jgi:hypothetical protein
MERLQHAPSLTTLHDELTEGLRRYWAAAEDILAHCGVRLHPPDEQALSLPKNFFSLLFLYTYRRAGIDRRRRILYAATLQCLRGMVTGCDNLLDDEYKPTLETDIPESGVRFRSVVDIMVSDRVLFQVLADAAAKGVIPPERVLSAATASMQTMMRSGIEEASEEGGVATVLTPAEVLDSVHHYKTGILFKCPWDIPRAVDAPAGEILEPLLEGLYHTGMGCQILDDMVDLAADVRSRKHNYIASLIYHGSDAAERERLARAMQSSSGIRDDADIRHYPMAAGTALEAARRLMTEGLGALFDDADQVLVAPAMGFLEKRIGAPPAIPDDRS